MTNVYIIAIPNASQYVINTIAQTLENVFERNNIEEVEIVLMAGEAITKEKLREILFEGEEE